jgi:predicted NAD/FAD-binding protein
LKIAIVGAGISGLTAAWLLHDQHDITVFEAAPRLGGHTNTIDVTQDGQTHAVDTGFIVYNNKTYPRFSFMLDKLGVATQESDMSFSVRNLKTGYEYGGRSLGTLYAQKSNLLNLPHHRMFRDILRFYKQAGELLEPGQPEITLGDYLTRNRYSKAFLERHLIPMGAAVWSAPPAQMLEFPAKMFVQFFKNHGFMDMADRPVWRVIKGGSREYLKPLTAPYADKIRLGTPIERIERRDDRVEITPANSGETESFDHVALACHSNQALAMLGDPSEDEQRILGTMPYQPNPTVLHTNAALMPRRKSVWSSWNYHLDGDDARGAAVTYCMNILQSLHDAPTYLVTLNRPELVEESTVIERINYEHPVYTLEGIAARNEWATISNTESRTHYCGAYWLNGFHEDGVASAERVAVALGADPILG